MKVNFISETHRRLTQREIGRESREALGTHDIPTGMIHGLGYNWPRFRKAIRRAEGRGAEPLSWKETRKLQAAGSGIYHPKFTAAISRAGATGKSLARNIIRKRASKRPEDLSQDIEGMSSQMRKDPKKFAPSAMWQYPKDVARKKGHAQISGRTRNLIRHVERKESHNFLKLPVHRHEDSVKRFEKWSGSPEYKETIQKLRKGGRHLRGQDPRLHPADVSAEKMKDFWDRKAGPRVSKIKRDQEHSLQKNKFGFKS